jgi:hypothetical protein
MVWTKGSPRCPKGYPTRLGRIFNFRDFAGAAEYEPRARMRLDVDCLREAKLENLERLARALGVRVPDRAGRSYPRRLVRAVLKRLDDDARRHRRMSASSLKSQGEVRVRDLRL